MLVLLMTALLTADEPQLRREIPIGSDVATGRDAVKAALADAQTLEHPKYAHYVWIPDWVEPDSGFAQVSHIANSTFTRTSNIVQPVSLWDGKFVRIDLAKFVTSQDQLLEVSALYELLRLNESFFNTEVLLTPEKAIVVDSRGQKTTQAQPAKTVFAAAPYLFPEGAELFKLTNSAVPIMRLDEFVAFTFSTVNGGKYYELCGVEKTLEKTVEKFCGKEASQKVVKASELMRRAAESKEKLATVLSRLDFDLAKTKAYISESGVTHRQRIVLIFYGTATAPASGPQTAIFTFDIGEGNDNPNNDPLRNPAGFETYDGGEGIVMLPNGMLLYLVFNNKDEIIAAVPDNVAWDHQAQRVRPNVGTVRVFSGVSCANCHEAGKDNWGWQPIANDLHIRKLIDDKGQADQLRGLQVAAAQFGSTNEELKQVLDLARLSYQYRAQLATNQKTTRETVAGLSDSYWGYWYDPITPQVAARDLGKMLEPADAQKFLLNAVDPKPIGGGLVQEDVVLDRLQQGKSVVPGQWRAQLQSFAERMLVKQQQAYKEN